MPQLTQLYIYEYLAIDSGGTVSDLVFAHNCCMARMLPGETELVSEWKGVAKSVNRFERSNGIDTALYKNIPLLRCFTLCISRLANHPGFAIRLRHSPWANFEVDWRNPKNPLSPKWRKEVAKGYTGKSTGIPKYESTYTSSAFRVYWYDFDGLYSVTQQWPIIERYWLPVRLAEFPLTGRWYIFYIKPQRRQ